VGPRPAADGCGSDLDHDGVNRGGDVDAGGTDDHTGWVVSEFGQRKKPAGAGQVLLAGTFVANRGLLSRSNHGRFQPFTVVAVNLDKASGLREGDVVFASEVAKLVVFGRRDRTPVGIANFRLVVGHVPFSKSARGRQGNAFTWFVVQKKAATEVVASQGGTVHEVLP
jgi:hypothetical protein